tara:strand:- start:79 stop:333 length:255 start_codon:yes stop_codon:yes gene_type:complete
MYTLSYANRYHFYKTVNGNMIFRLAVGGKVLKLNAQTRATFEDYEKLVEHGKELHVVFITFANWPYSLVFQNETHVETCKKWFN